jgi:hypothetical protein
MHGEVSWDHLDRLYEAYAAASVFIGEVREIETRISRATADLLRYPATFADLTALLATRAPTREMITRRIAWAAQHILGKRAWCVGSKVLVKLPIDDNAYGSPLLDQLRMLGFVSAGERECQKRVEQAHARADADSASPGPSPSHTLACEVPDGAAAFDLPALDKIDALCCSPTSDEVWVVKGCSYSQAHRLSPELWVNSDRDSLFEVDDRFMTRILVAGQHMRTLLASRDLVQAAYPQLKVRAAFIIINDPGCSWHFQAHDLTPARPEVSKNPKVKLDTFPVLATHRSFPGHFSKEGLELASLPDLVGDEPLTLLPADRPTRALLMLLDLWNRQLNRPKRLATARGEDLAESVARTAAVALGRDQWRHDLEDCLERNAFVRRIPDRPGRFAITPKGVGRALVLRSKLGAGPTLTPSVLLTHLAHQARLWAAAPVA